MATPFSQTVRTRIAPSPTGEDIHIGNVYTGLINFAFAKKHKGQFIIRIEDTDRIRYVLGAEEKILSTIRSFGLSYDEGPDVGGPHGPYRQSERLPLYQEHAKKLIDQNDAYYCFCTPQRLEEMRKDRIAKKQTPKYDRLCLSVTNAEARIKKGEKYVVRLKVPDNQEISFTDVIRGVVKIQTRELDDQVLLKSDGFPTYHLGVVVDDNSMEISHIIRAEEWISSTPKHVLLYKAFGWKLPIFAHLPILRNPDRSKLSKRKNPVWASWYLEEGFLPEAILNFLALLGWSHPEGKELFSLDEFIRLFTLEDVHPVGPVFDINKLKWMNGEYIRQLSAEELELRIKNHELSFRHSGKPKAHPESDSGQARMTSSPLISKLIPLAQSRMQTLKDFFDLTHHFFEDPSITLSDKEKEIARELHSTLQKLSGWTKDAIFQALKRVMEKEKIRMPVLYKIITGKETGLPLPESLELLGREKCLDRLKQYA